jgi:hypothetical protein
MYATDADNGHTDADGLAAHHWVGRCQHLAISELQAMVAHSNAHRSPVKPWPFATDGRRGPRAQASWQSQ